MNATDTPRTDALVKGDDALGNMVDLARKLERALSDCRQEVEEQARVNGMGASREARLMAELAEAKKALSDGPRWIPVGERVPEDAVEVLVTDGENVGVGDVRKGHLWNSYVDGPVTHWMPLPEAPKA